MEDDEVKSYMKQVIEDIKKDGSWDDSKIPEKIFNRAGKEETSTAYLGRVLIPRRIAGKGAGVLTLPAAEPLESPLAYSEEVSAAMGPLSPAPEGFIWISEENGYGKRIGEELEVSAGEGVMLNHEVALVKLRRGWIKGRKMKIEDVPAYVEQVRRRYQEYLDEGRLQEDLGLAAKPEAKPKEDDAASPEDARVLAIDWDAQGERYKEFKVAVQESEEYQWKDWPLEGPLCCLFLLKQMFRTAGSPKAWLATWARFKQVQEGDRIMFELRTLVDAIELAATYDQVNAPALASFETISRRIMAIVDAFSAGSSSAPDWGAAKIITGYKGPEDVVSPTLRQWAARRGKDEVELHQARTKMRDARKSLVDEAMAVSDGSLPSTAAPKEEGKRSGSGVDTPGPGMRPSKESLVLGPGQGWAFSQDRSCRLDPSREMRDLFPLPCPPKVCQEHRLSRRSQQRFDRKQKILADVQSAVNGLNWMHGFSPTFKFDSAPDPMQKQVLERMVHLSRVAAHQGSGPAWKPEAALRELLRGKSEYESPGMPISLARFDIERISLPTSLEGVPHVLDVLPEEAHHFLKSPEHMLRSEPPTEELITPYWDPILRNSKAAYKSLIKKLHAIGYLRFTRKPLAKAGLFFVHKSDRRKIRLIVDARQANQLFGSPPGVELCTSEGFARIEIEVPEQLEPGSPGFQQHLRERGLVFGLSDVKDCFHRLRQPHWLSRYFAWEEIPVSWVDDIIGTVVEGERVKKGDRLFPCPASLCMGFSWSLFFAQRSSEHLMSKVPSLVSSKIVSDRSEGISFKEADKGMVRHYVYVDNLGVISQDEAVVKRCLAELVPAFDNRGLILHPGELQADDVRALGCQMRSDLLAVESHAREVLEVEEGVGRFIA